MSFCVSLTFGAESPHCYRGPSVIDARQLRGDLPIDQNVVADIERRVTAMNIEATLQARDLPLNLHDSPDHSVLQCNMTRVAEWKQAIFNIDLGKSKIRLKFNIQYNFTMHAMETVRRMSRAFRLAKVPLMLAGGTLLGWYRECGILAHTEDLDFASISDHIVSMEHFKLLMVSFNTSSCFHSVENDYLGLFARLWHLGSGSNLRTSAATWSIHHDGVLSNHRS
jgi:hypothetical protein